MYGNKVAILGTFKCPSSIITTSSLNVKLFDVCTIPCISILNTGSLYKPGGLPGVSQTKAVAGGQLARSHS